ncbi:MAG: hypothetical protein IJP30_04475 [Clostridia bacterium]|nr:hypothetical protein [Clostridia bacterium]
MRTRPQTRLLVTLALTGTLLFVLQIVLQSLPNVEGVSLLIILSTLVFGLKTLYSVTLFVALEGLFYGFDLWWFSGYCVLWPLLCLLTHWFRKPLMANNLTRAVFSAVFGLCFGLGYALLRLPLVGFYGAFSYWVAGIPFDLVHMAGNFVLMLLLGNRLLPLMKAHSPLANKSNP